MYETPGKQLKDPTHKPNALIKRLMHGTIVLKPAGGPSVKERGCVIAISEEKQGQTAACRGLQHGMARDHNAEALKASKRIINEPLARNAQLCFCSVSVAV
jgi:hypothetical protein